MTPPLIGITAIPRPVRTMYGEAAAHTATDALVSSVVAAGGVPLLLPVVEPAHAALQAGAIEGLVLAGGQDVAAVTRGGPPDPPGAWVSPARDAHELALLAAARERGLPVLAVCRGLQLLNVALGGDLVTHVDGHDAGDRHEADLHPVAVVAGSLLADAIGDGGPIEVNTLHHQVLGRVADALRVTATSADGLVEAAEPCDGPWLVGVQWHPELLGGRPGGLDLFERLVALATA
jgi:putative glutamine amidotransferase